MRATTLSAAVVVALLGLAACGSAENAGTGSPIAQAAGQPAAVKSATDPLALVDCDDNLSQVASFTPTRSDPEDYFSDRKVAEIRQRGRLIVGTSGDVLQWGYRNPIDARLAGFDIDLLNKIKDALGVDRIEYRVINYADRLPRLIDGTVDIVAHTMTINCARWKQINFSSEYYDAGQRVLVRYDPQTKKPLFTDVNQMGGKTVCAGAGSTNIDNIKVVSDSLAKPIDIVEEADLGDCLVRFQLGQADAITGDDTVLAGFAEQDPYATVVGDKFSTEPYGLGFNKEDTGFTEYVNLLLDRWRSDGSLAALGKKYMKDQATAVPPAVYGRTGNPGPQS